MCWHVWKLILIIFFIPFLCYKGPYVPVEAVNSRIVCKTTGHSAHTQHLTSTMINWLNTHPTLAWNEWIHEPFLFTMLLGSSQNEVTRWSGGKPLSVYPLSGPLSIYLSIPVWPLKGGETGIQVFQFHFLLEHLVLLGPGAHLKRPDEQNILAVNVYMHLHHMVLRCMIYDNPLYVPHNSINIWISNNICFGLKPTIYNRRMYL